MQSLARVSFAVLALSCALICTVQSAAPVQLSLTPGTCVGAAFNDLGQKFHYDAQVAFANGDATCIRVSKLYVKDACIDKRNNELGLNTVKQVSCDQTDDVDTKTCESVFQSAPADAIVNGTAAVSGYYDSGDVCAAEADSYIYVQNTCTSTTNTTEDVGLTVTVTASDYEGSICISIAGHHINGVGIALIIVAILIVVAILALMCYCCCCRW